MAKVRPINTTQIGDEFEERSLNIIQVALQEGRLGIYSSQARIFSKKEYYSKDRDSHIKFDLTIEVWPPGAANYTLLFIIECKKYSKPVPVNDVEEFYAKIQQVTGVNVKGIFITNNKLQESAFKFARSKGMMLIEVNYDNSYNIILHKIKRGTKEKENRSNERLESWDDVLTNFLETVFNDHSKVIGLKQLSSVTIEDKALSFFREVDSNAFNAGEPLSIDALVGHLLTKYNVTTNFDSSIGRDTNGNPILGYYDRENRVIFVDQSLRETERFLFTFCHEIGHLVLHQNLKLNQKAYNLFKDSEYNFLLQRHVLKNPRHWIEWQANHFSACLILPKPILWARVFHYQRERGIRNTGTIYYDNQPVNRRDFYELTNYLTTLFQISFTSLKYRLEETEILIHDKRSTAKHWTNALFSDEEPDNDPRRRLRTE